ncbi:MULTISPECIES: PDR/VanB family oxidoreductase [unclassified Paraburkholderia]|uniref:PDR/VanB family oxidoreductase n=1 Tax=unclassified Paraburkholderia TaxID=2615204 RepID=UPI002AB1A959|nr:MULTISPECIES: PDR/VanB family oxidoreductase [unclassified Paraburkholderia]
MQTIPVIVDALSAQGRGNLAVRLVAADGGALPPFDAGAHIDVHLARGLIRQYSIASAAHERDHYVLCVKREAASRGGSAYVHERLRVGDRLDVSLPRNLFGLQSGQRHLLIAGGIGITPLLSMAESLEQSGTPFELHYYVREPIDAAFKARWRAGFTQGSVHIHSSSEGESARDALPAALHSSADGAQLYVCGPEGFMRHITQTARTSGWQDCAIHQEAFGASALPASADGASFQVVLASSGQVFNIAQERSIASVLLEGGVNVPLSCEMGICGACLTPVVEGVVDHRDTVQSDTEKCAANQQIALCCSRAHTPSIVIDL